MYIHKIIKVGNSHAITIPHSFVKKTGIKPGDKLAIEINSETKMIFIHSILETFMKFLSPQFFKWLNIIGFKKDIYRKRRPL